MKINGSSWKFALIFLSGVIIAAQLLFIIHWRWRFWQSQHWRVKLPPQWTAIDPQQQKVRINSEQSQIWRKQIIQEMVCPQQNQKGTTESQKYDGCYVIADGASVYGSGFARSLTMHPRPDILLAESDLDFPLPYTFNRHNARQWPVMANKVTLDYQKVIVAQPFITQTFTPSLAPWKVPEGKPRRILCLGLHGSAVNNFFANLSTKYDVTVVEPEPALHYIAKKWFGYEESGHHRIFVENPLFYLTARARLVEHPRLVHASRFHFIVVDLCHGFNSKTPWKCPMDEFMDEKVVIDLSNNLAKNGTIVVNIFSLNSKSDIQAQHQLANREHQMLQLYQRYFKNCYFLSIGSNLILTCSRKGPITRLRYHLAYRKLPKALQMFATAEEPKFFLDLEAT